MVYRKLVAPSLKEMFIQEIENMILSGELNIGDKLPAERDLVKNMGVSLGIVTTGIAQLESKGFLEIRPRQGIFVADYVHKGSVETLISIMRFNNGKLNDRQTRSFIEFRISNERMAIEGCIKHASDEELVELKKYLDTVKKSKNDDEFCEAVTDYYHEMYILSDNVLNPLIFYGFRIPIIGLYHRMLKKISREQIYKDVEKLYTYFVKRDTESAVKFSYEMLNKIIEGDASILTD